VLYPELVPLVGLHERGDDAPNAWEETLAAVDALSPSRPVLRMAALLHKIGLPGARTRDLRGGFRFTGHEQLGARKAEEVMRRLKTSNSDLERVVSLVARQSDLFPPDAPPSGIRRWLLHVDQRLVRDLFRLRIAMWRARPIAGGEQDLTHRWRRAHTVMLEHPVLETNGLAIDGSDLKQLGLAPGPRFGEILRALLDRVIEQPALNTKEQLLGIVQQEMAS
jgi:hypothetical protein